MNIIRTVADAKIVGGVDTMSRPNHYENGTEIDVIDFCDVYNLDFTEGNIVKYIVRYKLKNGIEDLEKARDYLDRLIQRELKTL